MEVANSLADNARKLALGYASACFEALDTLASSGGASGRTAAITQLLGALGRLEATDWKYLSSEQRNRVAEAIREILERARDFGLSPKGKWQIDQGAVFGSWLDELEGSLTTVDEALDGGDLADRYGSHDFEEEILGVRDALFFALRGLRLLEVEPAPQVVKRLDHLDSALRKVLPQALREFRRAGDSVVWRPMAQKPEMWWWLSTDS